MDLLLIRHGLPQRLEGDAAPADPVLAPTGVAQAASLAEWLEQEDLAAIYSSPMNRAVQTAAPLAERSGLEVTVDEDLAEFDRDLPFYIPMEELLPDDPRFHRLISVWRGAEGLPAREAFRSRVVGAVERVVKAHPSQRVAVVCHGGVINAYLTHILGLEELIFFEPDYTSINRVRAGNDLRTFVSANETGHLRGLVG
jgi:2,3-bisphosphoglycerate-dependent phosphoglycerate mutase